MPTIKIVPFPGAPGPRGIQGPRGYQGDQGLQGPAANTGDFTFTDSTLNTTEDMTIGVTGVPGVVNISAYAGVNIQTHADFGLYVNGIEPNNKVITQGELVTTMSGATGSFLSNDNKTVTVVNGIITSIE